MTTVQVSLPCVHCGHPLEAMTADQACTHCGRRVGQMYRVGDVDQATGTIAIDVACTTCGYDLRTLPVGSVCPECGQPVASSLRRDGLHLAGPRWLRHMDLGLRLLILYCFLQLALTCVILGSSIMGRYMPESVDLLFFYVVPWALLLCWIMAVYVITRPDEGLYLSGSARLPRWLRRAALALLAASVLWWALAIGAFLWARSFQELRQIGLGRVLSSSYLWAPRLVWTVITAVLNATTGILLLIWLRLLARKAARSGESTVLGLLVVGTVLHGLLNFGAYLFLWGRPAPVALYRTWFCADSAVKWFVTLTSLIVCIRLSNAVWQAIALQRLHSSLTASGVPSSPAAPTTAARPEDSTGPSPP